MYNNSKNTSDSDESLLSWAKSYLCIYKNVEKDYSVKYEQYKIKSEVLKNKCSENIVSIEEKSETIATEVPVEETEIFKEFKKYRLKKAGKKKLNHILYKMIIS